ncbi:hypothetical protein BU24DRAFT_164789 [Aaosphaeria arxii CBS 175.79]|uniref:Uncharacterized protein n=1 Tax=Aaosphaeria arxii CBS 175.79 TaxID=1450172 RepID=A0A6A5XXR4_9PLEO|nr:uncharacterized protein BU24DRAFT_164789 [Aaosphaeria arxii CBS 175.79]KAF2018098.1 hypothetical protein BU24DRAFT_164789 [Aaosphaeria arxii CBS 175.79]
MAFARSTISTKLSMTKPTIPSFPPWAKFSTSQNLYMEMQMPSSTSLPIRPSPWRKSPMIVAFWIIRFLRILPSTLLIQMLGCGGLYHQALTIISHFHMKNFTTASGGLMLIQDRESH